MTTDILSFDLDVSSFRPSTELRVFSISLVTLVSISDALAPGYVVITIMYGGSISGNWSIGSFRKEKTPNIITAAKISTVETGLSIAVLYILINLFPPYLL